MPSAKWGGVEEDFVAVMRPSRSSTTQSVKVPPMSTPTRNRATFAQFCRVEGGIVAHFDPPPRAGVDSSSSMHTRGFTLLELMVVIGIVAILALIAIPTYQDKFIRDQIAEALPLADIAKPPVALSWAALQTFPAHNAAAGLPIAEKIVNNYVSSVSIQGGAINITFGNRANGVILGKVLTLRPAVVEDAPIVPVTWVCGYATAPEKMTVKGEKQDEYSSGLLADPVPVVGGGDDAAIVRMLRRGGNSDGAPNRGDDRARNHGLGDVVQPRPRGISRGRIRHRAASARRARPFRRHCGAKPARCCAARQHHRDLASVC